MRWRVRANAKVNLYLRVGPKRSDGFHELDTVFQSVGLHDDLSFASARSPGVHLRVELPGGDLGHVPSDATNLVTRAVTALLERTPEAGIDVVLTKRIPSGGGLGGGSADAAAALIAVNECLELGLSLTELSELGLGLGSDVPFCLSGGAARAGGRGEVLVPLGAPGAPLWFVLGLPVEPLLTEDVYACRDRIEVRHAPPPDRLIDALGAGDPAGVAAELHNDLEAAAFTLRPELQGQKAALLEAGALNALLSGSGPTLFGLCRDEPHAREVAERAGLSFRAAVAVPARPTGVEAYLG